jgi:hypothetical protein
VGDIARKIPTDPIKKLHKKEYFVKGTWQRGGFSGVFAESGSA